MRRKKVKTYIQKKKKLFIIYLTFLGIISTCLMANALFDGQLFAQEASLAAVNPSINTTIPLTTLDNEYYIAGKRWKVVNSTGKVSILAYNEDAGLNDGTSYTYINGINAMGTYFGAQSARDRRIYTNMRMPKWDDFSAINQRKDSATFNGKKITFDIRDSAVTKFSYWLGDTGFDQNGTNSNYRRAITHTMAMSGLIETTGADFGDSLKLTNGSEYPECTESLNTGGLLYQGIKLPVNKGYQPFTGSIYRYDNFDLENGASVNYVQNDYECDSKTPLTVTSEGWVLLDDPGKCTKISTTKPILTQIFVVSAKADLVIGKTYGPLPSLFVSSVETASNNKIKVSTLSGTPKSGSLNKWYPNIPQVTVPNMNLQTAFTCSARDYAASELEVRPVIQLKPESFLFVSTGKGTGTVTTGSGNYLTAKDTALQVSARNSNLDKGYTVDGNKITITSADISTDTIKLPLSLKGNKANEATPYVLIDDGSTLQRYAGGGDIDISIDLSKIPDIKKNPKTGKYLTQELTFYVYNNDVVSGYNIDYASSAAKITVSIQGTQEIVFKDTNEKDKTIDIAYGDTEQLEVKTISDSWDTSDKGKFRITDTSGRITVAFSDKVENLLSGTYSTKIKAFTANGTSVLEIVKGGNGTDYIDSNTLKVNLKFKKKEQKLELTSSDKVDLTYGDSTIITAGIPASITNYDTSSDYKIKILNEQGIEDNSLLTISEKTVTTDKRTLSLKVTPLKGNAKATVQIVKLGDGSRYIDSDPTNVSLNLKLRPQEIERVGAKDSQELIYGNELIFGFKIKDGETNWDTKSDYEYKLYKNNDTTENAELGRISVDSKAADLESMKVKLTALKGVDTLHVKAVKKGDGEKYADSDVLDFAFVLKKRPLTLATKAVSGFTGQEMPSLTYTLINGDKLITDTYPDSIKVETKQLKAASDTAVDVNNRYNAIGTWKLVFSDSYIKDTSDAGKKFRDCYDVSFNDYQKDNSVILTVKQDTALQSWLDVSPECIFNSSLNTCWNNSNVTFKVKNGAVATAEHSYNQIEYKNGSTYGPAKANYVLSNQDGKDMKQTSYHPTGYTFRFKDSKTGAYSSDITSRNIRIDSTKPLDFIFSIQNEKGMLSSTNTGGKRFYNDGFYVKATAKDEESGIREETFKAHVIDEDGLDSLIGGIYEDKELSQTISGIQANTKSLIKESLNFNFKKDFKGTIKVITKNEAGLETEYTSPVIVNETPLEADVVVNSLADTDFISESSKNTYRFPFEVKAPHSGIKSVRYGIKDDNGKTMYEQPENETLNTFMNIKTVQNNLSDTTVPTYSAILNEADGILFKDIMDKVQAMPVKPEYLMLRIYVETNAGNRVTEDFKILFDFDAPIIQKFMISDEKTWVNTEKQVMLTLSDGKGSGIDADTLKIIDPEGKTVPCSNMLGFVSFSAPMNGTYHVSVKDKAGNEGKLDLSIIKIDLLKPELKNISYEPGGTDDKVEVLDQKTVTFTLNDPGNTDQVSGLDGNPIIIKSSADVELPVITKNANGTYSFVAKQNAVYTIQMKDNAGNVLDHEITVKGILHPSFTLDLSANNNVVGNYYQDAKITYQFSTTENSAIADVKHVNVMYNSFDGMQETVSDKDTTAKTETFTVKKNGTYTVTITTKGGAVISETIAITQILLEKPIVKLESDVPSNTWSNHDITLTLSNTNVLLEGKGDIKYEMKSNGSYALTSSPVTITSSGTYTFRAVSASGVVSNEVTYQAKIDKAKPTISNITEYTGNWTNQNRTVNFDVKDVDSEVKQAVIISAPENINPPKVTCTTIECEFVATTNGDYVVQVEDHAGNVSDEKTITVDKIDKTAVNLRAIVLDRTQLVQKAKIQIDLLAVGESKLQTLAVEYRAVGSSDWTSKGNIKVEPDSTSVIYEADANGFYHFKATNHAGSEAFSNEVEVTKVSTEKPSVNAVFTYRDQKGESQTYNTDGTMWVNTRVDVTLSSSLNDVRYEMKIGDGDYEKITGNKVTFVNNMESKVWFKAISQSEVSSDESNEFTVLIHKGTPDQPKLTVPADFKEDMWYAYGKTMEVTYTPNDKLGHSFSETVEVSINDGSWTTLSGKTYNPDTTFSGAHEMRFRVKDSAGNVSEITKGYLNIDKKAVSAELMIEKENSVGILEKLTGGRFFNRTTKIHVVGTAGESGVYKTYYELSDTDNVYGKARLQEGSSFYVEPNFKGTVHGVVTNHALLKNATGDAPYDRYVSQSDQVDNIVVDSELPTITYVYPSTWTSQETMEVSIKDVYATLDTDKIYWYVEGDIDHKQAITLDQDGKTTITIPNEGAYNIIVEAHDKSGNIAIKTIPVQFDKSAPTISAYTFTPEETAWTNTSKKISFTIDEPVSGLASEVVFTKGNKKIYAVRQPDGSYQAEFSEVGTYDMKVADLAGNELVKDVTISRIDPNKTVLTSSADQSKYQKEITIDLTYNKGTIADVSDLVSIDVVYTPFNDGPRAAERVDITAMKYTAKANGTYVFTARNEAGTLATSTIIINHVDAAVPELKVTGYVGDTKLASGTWTNQDVRLVIENTNEEVKSVTLKRKLDDGAYEDFNGDWTDTITESHKVTYQAVSENGEVSKEVTYQAKIDKVKPVISNITGNTGDWTNQNRTVKFDVKDVDSEVKQAVITSAPENINPPKVTCTKTQCEFVATTNGKYVVQVEDHAGNVSDAETIIVDKIDKSAVNLRAIVLDRTQLVQKAKIQIDLLAVGESKLQTLAVDYRAVGSSNWTSKGNITVGPDSTSVIYEADANGFYRFKATNHAGSEAYSNEVEVTKVSTEKPSVNAVFTYRDQKGESQTYNTDGTMWVNTRVDVTLSSSLNDVRYEMKIGDGDYEKITGNKVTFDKNMESEVRFKAISQSEVSSDESNAYTVLIHQGTPDQPKLTVPADFKEDMWYAYGKTMEVTYTPNDKPQHNFKETVEVSINDGSWTTLSGTTYNPESTFSGAHEMRFRVVDSAGNVSEITKGYLNIDKKAVSAELMIEKENSVGILEKLTGGRFFNRTTKIHVVGTAGESGVYKTYYELSDTDNAYDKTRLQEGTSFYVEPNFKGSVYGVVTNHALVETPTSDAPYDRYVSQSDQVDNIVVDSELPTITYVYPSTWTSQETMEVSIKDVYATLDTDKIYWYVEGDIDHKQAITLDQDGKTTITLPNEGAYNIIVEAHDKAGNIAIKTIPVQFDKTEPKISAYTFTPEETAWTNTSKKISFTIDESVSGLANEVVFTKGNKKIYAVRQPDGSYQAEFAEVGIYDMKVADLAGNELVTNVTISHIDPNKTTLTSSADQSKYQKEIEISLTYTSGTIEDVSDLVSIDVVYTPFNDGPRAAESVDIAAMKYTAKANGTYVFTARNEAGTLATSTIIINHVDAAVPELKVTGYVGDTKLASGTWTNQDVRLVIENTNEEVKSVTLKRKLDDSAYEDFNGDWTDTITESHKVTYQAVSENGEVSNEVSFDVLIDRNAPTISNITNTGALDTDAWKWKSRIVSFEGKDIGGSGLQDAEIISVPEGAATPVVKTGTSATYSFHSVANGDYVVRLYDIAGNYVDETITIAKIVSTYPSISAEASDLSTYQKKITFTITYELFDGVPLDELQVCTVLTDGDSCTSEGIEIENDHKATYTTDQNGTYYFKVVTPATKEDGTIIEAHTKNFYVDKLSQEAPTMAALYEFYDIHEEEWKPYTSSWVNTTIKARLYNTNDAWTSGKLTYFMREKSLEGIIGEWKQVNDEISFTSDTFIHQYVQFKALAENTEESAETPWMKLRQDMQKPSLPQIKDELNFQSWYAYDKQVEVKTVSKSDRHDPSFTETLYVSLDDGQWEAMKTNVWIPRPTLEGVHKLSFQLLDSAGNASSIKELWIKMDKVMPEVVMRITNNAGSELLSQLTGGYFYHDVQRIDLETEKVGESDVRNLYHQKGLKSSTWIKGSSFNLYPQFVGNLYAKIENNALDEEGAYVSNETVISNVMIETQKPTLRVTYPTKWSEESVVSVYAEDVQSDVSFVNWTLDDVTTPIKLSEGKGSFQLPKEGAYEILVKAQDRAGNVAEVPVQVKYDKTAPDLVIEEVDSTLSDHKDIRFMASDAESGIDVQSIYIQNAKGKVLPFAKQRDGSYIVSVEENGTYSIEVSDFASHTTIKEVEVHSIHTDGPRITIAASTSLGNKESDVWVKESRTIAFYVTPVVSLEQITVTNAYGEKQNVTRNKETNEYHFTAMDNGSYEIQAVDAYGNASSLDLSIAKIAKRSPVIRLETNEEQWQNSFDVSAYVFAKDAPLTDQPIHVYYKASETSDWGSAVANLSLQDQSSYARYTIRQNGDYRFVVKDQAGYESEEILHVTSIDNASAQTKVTMKNMCSQASYEAGTWTNCDVEIALSNHNSEVQNKQLRYEYLEGNAIDENNPAWQKVEDPEHFLVETKGTSIKRYLFRAVNKDVVETVSKADVKTIKIDKTKPQTPTILRRDLFEEDDWYQGSTTISFERDGDEGSTWSLQRDLGDGNGFTTKGVEQSTPSWTNDQVGYQKVRFRYIDEAGNVSNTIQAYVNIDADAPTLHITMSEDTSANLLSLFTGNVYKKSVKGTIYASGTYAPIRSIRYRILPTDTKETDIAWVDGSEFVIPADFKGRVIAQAESYNGLKQEITLDEFIVDQSGPIITLPNEPSAMVNDPTLRIQITDSLSGLKEASYQDRSAISPIAISLPIKDGRVDETLTLPDGMHILTIHAVDMAGNMTNRSYIMDIDTTGPEIKVSKQSEGWSEERQVCMSVKDERSAIRSQTVTYNDLVLPFTEVDGNQCFTVTENGEYKLQAEDTLGNASSYVYYETRIDHGIPQIKLMNAVDDTWVSGYRDVTFAVSKGLVGIDEVYISDEKDARIDAILDHETEDEWIYQARILNNGAYVIHAFTPKGKEGTYRFDVQRIDQGTMEIHLDALDTTADTQVKATLQIRASESPIEGVRVYYAQDKDHKETLLETLSPTMIQEGILETMIKRNGSYRYELFNACGDTISTETVEVDWLLSTAVITDVTMTTKSGLAYTNGRWSREDILVNLRNVNPTIDDALIIWQMRKNKEINAQGEEDWQVVKDNFTIETEAMISDSYEFRGVVGNVIEYASMPYIVNIDKTDNATPEIIKAEQYGKDVWFANNTDISASFLKKDSTIKETLQVSTDDGRTWDDLRTCSTVDTLELDGSTCKGTYTQSKAGSVSVAFRVIDEAGNQSKDVAQTYVNIDRKTPTVEIELRESAVNELMNNLTLHQYFNKTIHGTLHASFGAGGGEVYYQLVSSGKPYEDHAWVHGDEFVIEPNWKGEIYAKAVSVSGMDTIIHYDPVIIADEEAPRIELPEEDSSWRRDNAYEIKVSDNLSGVDLSQLYMKINEDAPQYLSSQDSVLRLPDGAYEVSVTAYDKAQNHDTQSRAIRIDTEKPVITVDAPATQIAAYQDVTFSIEDVTSGVDSTRIVVVDEQGAELPVSSAGADAYTFRAQHSGIYEINAYDIAGNKAESVFVDIANVDDDAPVIQAVTITPDLDSIPWVSDQRTVRFGVIEDGIGLRDGQPCVQRGKERLPLTKVNDTTYEFIADQNADYIITAEDNAGNKAKETIVEVRGIDTSAPSTMLVQISERKASTTQQILNTLTFGKFFKDGFEVTLTAKDEESQVASFTWWYGDENNHGEEHVVTTNQGKVRFILEDITQQDILSAYAMNHAGLSSAIASSNPITNEATLPEVRVVSGSKVEDDFIEDEEDVYRAESYWLQIHASDMQSGLAKIEYSYRDGAGLLSDRYTLWNASEEDGLKNHLTSELSILEDLGIRLADDTRVPIDQITFYVSDRSGNEQIVKKAIFLDLEAPSFVSINQPQGTNFMKEKVVEMKITDDRSGIKEVRGVDPNEDPIIIMKNEEGMYTFTALVNGEYQIEAEDEVGNIRSQSIRVSHVDSSEMEITELKGHTSEDGEKWASGKRTVNFHIKVGTSGLAKDYPIVWLDGIHKVPVLDLGYGDYSFTTTIMGDYTIQLKNNAGVIFEREFVVDKIDENDPVIEFVK